MTSNKLRAAFDIAGLPCIPPHLYNPIGVGVYWGTMRESKNAELSKKAFEICYAAFRVSTAIENRVFVEHLEAWALALLEAVNAQNEGKAEAAILNLEYLINLGRNLNLISQTNFDLFVKEIRIASETIKELSWRGPAEIDLSGIFTGNGIAASPAGSRPAGQRLEGALAIPTDDDNNSNGMVKSAIRQSAIIDKLRQSGICRLKDIQDVFPDVSERTLRYDIQNLIERGIVSRIGNGGPATAYRLSETRKEELPAPSYSGQ